MNADLLLTITGAFVALAAAVEAIRRLIVNPVRRVAHQWQEFWSDWKGEPARHGVPARPGVMERIALIEQEFRPNGGRALRDRVEKVAEAVNAEPAPPNEKE